MEQNANNAIATIGRRKSAVARLRLTPAGKGTFTVNAIEWKTYFPTIAMQELVSTPLKTAGRDGSVDISVKVSGGGKKGQSEAVRLAIARALVKLDEATKKPLKALGMLSRDARVKERKKPGLRKARRAPQWSKR